MERLQLQSRVWEPGGRQLLSRVADRSGRRALDLGCGAMGWLRVLSEWVGSSGQIMGTHIDESLLAAARSFLEAERISNVELVVDDLFESKLEPQSFDLVHARFVIAPLGRGREQVDCHRRLVRPGGSLGGRSPPEVALESRLLQGLSEGELASLRREAETELAEPGSWGTTFTLIQGWAGSKAERERRLGS